MDLILFLGEGLTFGVAAYTIYMASKAKMV